MEASMEERTATQEQITNLRIKIAKEFNLHMTEKQTRQLAYAILHPSPLTDLILDQFVEAISISS
jgi:hypothetical protein